MHETRATSVPVGLPEPQGKRPILRGGGRGQLANRWPVARQYKHKQRSVGRGCRRICARPGQGRCDGGDRGVALGFVAGPEACLDLAAHALQRSGRDDAAIAGAIAHLWTQRTDRYSEVRSSETAGLRQIEMSYIGG